MLNALRLPGVEMLPEVAAEARTDRPLELVDCGPLHAADRTEPLDQRRAAAGPDSRDVEQLAGQGPLAAPLAVPGDGETVGRIDWPHNGRHNLANALAALQVGITHFDSAFGGMGGCPFVKGASGNIATEDLVFMFHQMGIETGIDASKIAVISRSLEDFFKRRFSGTMHQLLNRDDVAII